MVFGQLTKGVEVLDRMASVMLQEPKKQGKPVPEQRVRVSICWLDVGGEHNGGSAASIESSLPRGRGALVSDLRSMQQGAWRSASSRPLPKGLRVA